jgi:hypothetical protein
LGDAGDDRSPPALAQKALALRLDAEVRANTLELITLHGLEGKVQGEILARVATNFDTRLRVDEGKAALWGGAVSGALVGLKADILSGGLTLGGGLLAGGLLGALGAAGLARCVNIVRGTDRSWVAWNAQALDQMLEAALLRYLAVAHFGRGRGDWVQGESPAHWQEVIQRSLAAHRDALAVIWKERDMRGSDDVPIDDDALAAASAVASHATRGPSTEAERLIAAAVAPIVTQAASDALRDLYPDANPFTEAPVQLGETAKPGAMPTQ